MQSKLSEIRLEHNSYISLHVQLHNQLRQLIVSGRWRQQERIPSESQLAQHLNISRTTVRIALQSAEVEGLIKRVAGRGTFVSHNPTSTASTRFIGYVARSFHNEIHQVLLGSAETELRSGGCRVIFSNANDTDEEVEVLEELLNDDISGLLLWPNANPTDAHKAVLQKYHDLNIPIVFIDRFVDGIEADYVASDNYGGMYALVNHLIELGHERIVHLRHNISNLFPVDERLRGFEAAMKDHGLALCDLWKINSPDHDEFFETDIHQLLENNSQELMVQVIALMENASPRPTAIVCANDAMAIITLRAMREMGIEVPAEVSVAGFDDIKLVSYMDVPLTTVTQDAHTIGQLAARTLLDRLDGGSTPTDYHSVPTRLQIRMSTSTPIETKRSQANDREEVLST